MSTDGSSLGWSDLVESRPLSSSSSSSSSGSDSSNSSSSNSNESSSSSSDAATVHMSPKQTQTQLQHSEQLTTPPMTSLPNLWDDPAEPKTKDTYIIYSAGNATLFMSSLDPQLANDRQLELLDRHLLDVKIAEPLAPLWPNPSVLTIGMRCTPPDTLSGSSSMAKTMSAAMAKRKLYAKSKCLKVFGQKKRINRVQAK